MEMQGTLRKRRASKWKSLAWRQRFCRLDPKVLAYYKNDSAVQAKVGGGNSRAVAPDTAPSPCACCSALTLIARCL